MNRSAIILTFLIGILLLSACNPAVSQPTITPTPLPTETAKPLPTATATSEPTPTPDRFSAEALAFIPHTIDEIGQSVEVRSPIDDPEGYKEDISKVLAVIHEQILPEYYGELIMAGRQQIGILMDDSKVIAFQSESLLYPIASVYFKWKNYDVPRLFFPAEDNQGKFTLSIILNPTMDFINTVGRKCNPAPDWHLKELIKNFPMQITGGCSFEAMYYYNPAMWSYVDEFIAAYYSNSDSRSEEQGNLLREAYWSLLGKDGTFDRRCELISLVAIGGQ